MKVLSDGLIPVQVGNAELLVPDTDADQLSLLYRRTHQWYEPELLAAIKERQSGGVFVDVGCGAGNHTMHFSIECQADKVIAVEPYAGNYAILLANVLHSGLEDVVEPHRALIHPTWKSATLKSRTDQPLPETWCYSNQPLLVEGGATPCLRLDTLLEDEMVAVLKIDVEEMGPMVLATAMDTIEQCTPLIAIEAEPSEEDAIESLLRPLGYEIAGVFCATPTFLWEAT